MVNRHALLAGMGALFLVGCAAVQSVPLAELRALPEGATARFLYLSSGGKAEAYLVRALAALAHFR
jgi:hypothetical protein